MELTPGRHHKLLDKISSMSLDSLIEMASWRRMGHAYFARIILGRVAGLPEDRLKELARKCPVETIIEAASKP
jgi:hypothetical protein